MGKYREGKGGRRRGRIRDKESADEGGGLVVEKEGNMREGGGQEGEEGGRREEGWSRR